MRQKGRLKRLERTAHPKQKPMLALFQDLDDKELFHHKESGKTYTRADFSDLGEKHLLFVVVYESE